MRHPLFVITPQKLATGNMLSRLTISVAGYDVPALRQMLDAGNTDGWDCLMLAMVLRFDEVRRVYMEAPLVTETQIDRAAVTAELELMETEHAAGEQGADVVTEASITTEQIHALQDAALRSDDRHMLRACQAALRGGHRNVRMYGRQQCADAINVSRRAVEAAT